MMHSTLIQDCPTGVKVFGAAKETAGAMNDTASISPAAQDGSRALPIGFDLARRDIFYLILSEHTCSAITIQQQRKTAQSGN